MIALGFTRGEVEEIMGGPMPKDDPDQRRAYAVLAHKRLAAFDAHRYDVAFLLLDAPDDLLDEWQRISSENSRRVHADHGIEANDS